LLSLFHRQRKLQKERGRETWPRLRGARTLSRLLSTHVRVLPDHWCFSRARLLNQLHSQQKSVKAKEARAQRRQRELEHRMAWPPPASRQSSNFLPGTAAVVLFVRAVCTARFEAFLYFLSRKSAWLGKIFLPGLETLFSSRVSIPAGELPTAGSPLQPLPLPVAG